jgi:outer membrane protein OmpA-like peptidoglycan-associated protein
LQQALQDLPSLRILFGTEGNRLTVDSLDILDQIAETIIQYPDTQVIIEGHTDATGEPDHNLRLSLLRATTVRDYLIRQGVSVYSLRAIGLGEAVPLIPNSNPEGRAKNRRIEFTFR